MAENLSSADVQAISARINAILARAKAGGEVVGKRSSTSENVLSVGLVAERGKSSYENALSVGLVAERSSTREKALSAGGEVAERNTSESALSVGSVAEGGRITNQSALSVISVAQTPIKENSAIHHSSPVQQTPNKKVALNSKGISLLKQQFLSPVNKPNASGLPVSRKAPAPAASSIDRSFLQCKIERFASVVGNSIAPSPLELANEVVEYAVTWELLVAFLGVQLGSIGKNSSFVFCDGIEENSLKWRVHEDLEPSAFHFVASILPVVCDIACLKKCIKVSCGQDNRGRVFNALLQAISKLIAQFEGKLAAFEGEFWNGSSSLLKLWILIEPWAKLFASLVQTLQKVLRERQQQAKGSAGPLINLLYAASLASRGSEALVHEAMLEILAHCSKVYSEIVKECIWTGGWRDEAHEFMVIPKLASPTDDEHCLLAFQKACVPYFLVDCAENIYKIAKFHSIFTRCSVERLAWYSSKEELLMPIEAAVELAFNRSSKRAFEFFVQEKRLFEHLQVLEDYFLFGKIEFFQLLFTQLSPWLLKAAGTEVGLSKVTSTFSSLKTSANCFAEAVKIEFSNKFYISNLLDIIHLSCNSPLEQQFRLQEGPLKVCDALSLDYCVEYPLNILFSKRTISKYQLLFRHLLFLFSIDHRLSQKPKDFLPFIRWKIVHFLGSVRSFFLADVIQPKWQEYFAQAKACDSLHHFTQLHDAFLDSCMKECMLTDSKLLKMYSKLLAACVSLVQDDDGCGGDDFLLSLKMFIDALYFQATTDSSRHLMKLLLKLDFNRYYAQQFRSCVM